MNTAAVLSRVRIVAPYAVGVALTGSAVIHTVAPGVFRPLIPPWLPGDADLWVRGSGVAEGVAGVGLLTARPWAGRFGALVLLGIWLGNVQMALDAGHGKLPAVVDDPVVAWARVPLQLPLVWAALQSRPRPGRRRRAGR